MITIKDHKQYVYLFGLDSFHFQSKLLVIENEDLMRLYSIIINRMYCEFFKLYKLMADYIGENINDEKILILTKNNPPFPIYKDLEPQKKYDFELIKQIHERIIMIISSLNSYINMKQHELNLHLRNQKNGLYINNFVTAFHYNWLVIHH